MSSGAFQPGCLGSGEYSWRGLESDSDATLHLECSLGET